MSGDGFWDGGSNFSLCTNITKNMNSSLTARDSPAHTRFPNPNGTNWLIFCQVDI